MRNACGQTALHAACDAGHAEVVELLCAASADPRLGDVNKNEIPGFYALKRHSESVATESLENSLGATTQNWHNKRRIVCLVACLTAMQSWNPESLAAASLVNSFGITGLHIAAAASNIVACEVLMRFEAPIDATELSEGMTPLMYALRAKASLEMVDWLLRVHADLQYQDSCGGQPLHYAVAVGDDGIASVDMLLRARAIVDAVDKRGASALALAGLRGSPATVRCLLAAGARPHGCRAVLPLMPAATSSGDRSCRDILESVM